MKYTMQQFDDKVDELMSPGATGISKFIADTIEHANFEDVEELCKKFDDCSESFGFYLMDMMQREAEQKAEDHFELDQEGD